jgi:hypothetical protein
VQPWLLARLAQSRVGVLGSGRRGVGEAARTCRRRAGCGIAWGAGAWSAGDSGRPRLGALERRARCRNARGLAMAQGARPPGRWRAGAARLRLARAARWALSWRRGWEGREAEREVGGEEERERRGKGGSSREAAAGNE